MLTMVLAFLVDLLNVKFMILFLAIYAVYSSVLSLTAFFSRIHTIDLKISFSDVLKAILLCFFEVSVLRFALAWVRMTALFGYSKRKQKWGKIQRQKIDLEN